MSRLVEKILSAVRTRGDAAVRTYARRFDDSAPPRFRIAPLQIRRAYREVAPRTLRALKQMASSVERFARAQKKSLRGFTYRTRHALIQQRLTPIERVGCYVPGGRFPLASTALMTIIPARVAGVKDVIVCTPRPAPEVLVAANLAEADSIFHIGGVQAIAAMAYGTETVPKVDMIVGPGNRWVVEAKKAVFGAVGIDLLAGPSELVVLADDSAEAKLVASELLAQAEHDPDAKVYLLTPARALAEKVRTLVGRVGRIRIVRNLAEGIAQTNQLAPEHLSLHLAQPRRTLAHLRHFGTAFVGGETSVVFGDYGLGPNHTLPTNGAARYRGGLSVLDFLRLQTIQKITARGVKKYVSLAQTLAQMEGLTAHACAAMLKSAGRGV